MRLVALLVVALAIGLVAVLALAGGEDVPRERGFVRDEPAPRLAQSEEDRRITTAGAAEHLRVLERIARRHGGNRAAGTAGERETADYIAEQLRATGWEVTTQDVRWPRFENRRRPVLGNLRYRRDFRELEYSGSATLRGRVKPLDTLGCEAANYGSLSRDDIVIVARGTCPFRRKALAAQKAGAGALVVAYRDSPRPVPGTLGSPGIRIPVLAVTGPGASRLARSRGPVRLVVDAISERARTRNVIGETAFDERAVMLGAHLDSVEDGPGINDNGSGIAALLELAERLRDRPGVRLGFWTAEEIGLFGSRHYVRRLPREERRQIVAYLNLDMVGTQRRDIDVYDTDDRIERILRAAVPGDEGEADIGGASDNAPFDDAGIPVGGLFTGLDRCYHRSCDTVSRTSATRAAAAARAAVRAVERLAR